MFVRRGKQSPQWAFMSWFEVMDPAKSGQVYLRRLRIVDTPFFGLYLHWINLPDRDRDPHDHPWKFASVILRGGYVERVWYNLADLERQAVRTWAPFSVHRMPLDRAHKIETLLPGTMTLVLRGRRSKSWGFWTDDGVVTDWSDYPQDAGAGSDPFDS